MDDDDHYERKNQFAQQQGMFYSRLNKKKIAHEHSQRKSLSQSIFIQISSFAVFLLLNIS